MFVDLAFERRGNVTVLVRRRFLWPFTIGCTFRLDEVPAHMATAIIQSTSGALLGEDRLTQRIEVGARAAVHVTSPGASVVQLARANDVSGDRIDIRIDDHAYLEYWPEARILFPGAALSQGLHVECAATGCAVIADSYTVHDPLGRDGGFRRLTSFIEIRRPGTPPLMLDRLEIADRWQHHGEGYSAFANVIILLPVAQGDAARLAASLNDWIAEAQGVYGGSSLLPSDLGVGVRMVGSSLQAVRLALGAVRSAARSAIHGAVPNRSRKDERSGG